MTPDESRAIMRMLATTWGQGRFSQPEVVLLFTEALADLPYDRVRAAVLALATTNEFPPVIATIRKVVYRQANLGGPTEDEAVRQAERLARFIEQQQWVNGSGYQPRDPGEIHETVRTALRCVGVEVHHERFRDQFLREYRRQQESFRDRILESNMGDLLACEQIAIGPSSALKIEKKIL